MSDIINDYSLILEVGFDVPDLYSVIFEEFVQVKTLLDLDDDLPVGIKSRMLKGFGSGSPPPSASCSLEENNMGSKLIQ